MTSVCWLHASSSPLHRQHGVQRRRRAATENLGETDLHQWLGYSEYTIIVGRETFALFHHALAMHAFGEHGHTTL